MRCFHRLFTVGIGVLVFGWSYANAAFTKDILSSGCKNQYCVAVIDAGSSGSRLHIYSYSLDNQKNPTEIIEQWVKKIKPGFANIGMTQAEVDSYLTSLFVDASVSDIPVYFYATAGMRLLSAPKQQTLYTYLQNWFNRHPSWHLQAAKTLTGKQEGIYGWLTVNYQVGALDKPLKKMIGMMDMGGASVEIVFPIADRKMVADADSATIKVRGKEVTLYSHSFLGLGQTELSHQFLDNPACFSHGYLMPEEEKGEGNAYFCQSNISVLVNSVHHVKSVVGRLIHLNNVSQWYVMGGVVDMLHSIPFQHLESTFTNRWLLDYANQNLCQQDWQYLQTLYPTDDYLYGYCLFASYYYALMVHGYSFDASMPIHYFDGTNPDWTMGVVLSITSGQ